MNQDNFLWGLQITDGLTMELVSQMTVIAFGVGVICFICNLAYNYLYHGASQLLSPNELTKFFKAWNTTMIFDLFDIS